MLAPATAVVHIHPADPMAAGWAGIERLLAVAAGDTGLESSPGPCFEQTVEEIGGWVESLRLAPAVAVV